MQKNPVNEWQIQSDSLNGIYRGIVEDNCPSDDSKKIGGCKIRIIGIHTSKKKKNNLEGIPTDELPIAYPALSLFEGSVSGFGNWCVPLQGSHVFVFFENGNILQPRYFASAPGYPTETPKVNEGFNDPDGLYPLSTRLNESDYHRLARGITALTNVEYKNSNLDSAVNVPVGSTSWNEPNSAYATVYPHNIIWAVHGGIMLEMDSTPNAKRFHIYHPSNSYLEIDNSGSIVFRNEKDSYRIIKGNEYRHTYLDSYLTIDRNYYRFVDGTERKETNENVYYDIGLNRDLHIGNDDSVTIENDCLYSIGNNFTITVGGDRSLDITGSDTILAAEKTQTISGTYTLTAATGSISFQSGGTIDCGGGCNINGSADLTIDIDGTIIIDGATSVIIRSAGNISLISDTQIDIDAPIVNIPNFVPAP